MFLKDDWEALLSALFLPGIQLQGAFVPLIRCSGCFTELPFLTCAFGTVPPAFFYQ